MDEALQNPHPPQADDELAAVQAELVEARAALAAMRSALARAEAERDAAVASASAAAEAQVRLSELETQSAELRAILQQAQDERLVAHRRAVLAENADQVVPELVAGDTPEAIDASVEVARAAYARAVEAARTQLQAERSRSLAAAQVPVGASPRTEMGVEELSPLAKITAALSRR